MTFESPEARDAYHKLNTELQVQIYSVFRAAAAAGYGFHIEQQDSEIIFRIHKNFIRGLRNGDELK